VLLAAATAAAAPCFDVLDAPDGGEVTKTGIDGDDDVASTTAVPSVRTAFRDVLLAAEAQATIAATAGLDVNVGPVVEHGRLTGEASLASTPRLRR
jgi:hypothetical protein